MNELKYTSTHEWLREDSEGAVIGITNHAQELLGDMVFVDLPEIGDEFTAGDEMGVVESVKAASDFYSPVSGKVIEVNEAVRENPAVVNLDPYHDGWLVKIKISQPSEMENLLTEEQYNQEIEED